MARTKYFLKADLSEDIFPSMCWGGYALFLGYSIVLNPKLGVIISILPMLIWFIVSDKINILYLLLALMPFNQVPFLNENLLNIPGAKPFNLLSFVALLACFYHGGQLLYNSGTIKRKVMIFLAIYFAFYSLATFRSLNYHSLLYMLDSSYQSSIGRYLLSYYIVPSLYLVSFLYILNHVTTEKDIKKITTFLCAIAGMLSITIIFLSIYKGHTYMMGRHAQNELMQTNFGLHYNTLGVFYIILGPLLIIPVIDKYFWGILNWCLAGVAIIFLGSRTAMIVFLFGTISMLYFLGKKKELIVLLAILTLFSLYFLPGYLLRTLQIGFESGDVDDIFTGRIDSIWLPLLWEWVNNPKLLFLGKGKYSMMTSSVYLKGIVLQTRTAHNAYVGFFLDNGIILFSGLIFYIIKFLGFAWQNVKRINSHIAWAFLMSIICYLIAAITGRKIYPSEQNMLLLPIIALLINYLNLHKAFASKNVEIEKEAMRQ